MKLIRILHQDVPRYGRVEGDTIHLLTGAIETGFSETQEMLPLSDAIILPPTSPTKIVAVGLNYRDHAEEFGEPIPAVPKIFLKPSTAVIPHGADILLPPMAGQVDFEAELAVVIARTCQGIQPDQAADYLLGYTCLNDVTARDLQRQDGQWTRAKGFDTFAPVGPVVETACDPSCLDIQLVQNGVVRQHSNTRHFIFPIPKLVAFISQVMTLLPGDIITTGTPSGVGPLSPGDRVEVRIDGVGTLTNGVRKARPISS